MEICSVPDCKDKHHAKGLCFKHYDRMNNNRKKPSHNVIGELVKHRRDAGMKLDDLAEKSGYSSSLMSKLEAGHRSPSFPTLMAWANTLGYDLSLTKKED